jgi:hypothetical protein
MIRRTLVLFSIIAMAGLASSCGDPEPDYTDLDTEWNAADSAYMVDYEAVRADYDRLDNDFKAMPASDDSAAVAQRAAAQARLDANRQKLQEMEATRTEIRSKQNSAKEAKDRAAYEAARKEADYAAWKAELDRMRADQKEFEGMITVGGKSVGGVDVHIQDTSKPLLRVEPGKEDDKPLIELNKNP